MKKVIFIITFTFFSLFFTSFLGFSQVGIGTSSVDGSARLQIDASNKGFLPPRIALQGTDDASLLAPSTPRISNPATGLLVYNTATAGSGASAVTPGFYYYDGSKWQRIINQQPDATVEFDKATPTTSGVVFTPNTPASKDYVYVSTVDNSQWTYNGTAYVTYTPPASTAWYAQSTTSDAGSNKTSGIYRTGNVGIGTTSFTPSTKLHIVASTSGTGFRLVDGSQGANKVLQSDANGNASWATNVAITPTVTGTMGVGAAEIGQNSFTGASITLPNGKWSVSVSMLAVTSATGNYWVRSGFSSSSTNSAVGADAVGATLVSGYVPGGGKYSMLNGTIIINNTSGANKTYYYWTAALVTYDGGSTSATFTNLGRNQFGENTIIAYPMN